VASKINYADGSRLANAQGRSRASRPDDGGLPAVGLGTSNDPASIAVVAHFLAAIPRIRQSHHMTETRAALPD
jgi:hypothetical protein